MSEFTEFSALNQSQPFDFLPGDYQIELFGAQGGSGLEHAVVAKSGGLGAKVLMTLRFLSPIRLYFYVGSKGADGNAKPNSIAVGGWNGGGDGGADTDDDDAAGAGGGSTDLRIIDKTDNTGINSRIAVAAGGSGGAFYTYGAPGGDLYIYRTNEVYKINAFEKIEEKPLIPKYPLFKGDNGKNNKFAPSSGAGGGYYGGTAVNGGPGDSTPKASTGGSSYVAGCNGEDEVTERLKNLGIIVLYWSATPGLPSIGHEGDGFATVQRLRSFTCQRKPRNPISLLILNFTLL